MKEGLKLTAILFIFLILSACGGEGSPPTPTPPTPPAPVQPNPSNPKADLAALLNGLSLPEFYDTAIAELSKREPEYVMNSGLADAYGLESMQLNDMSPEYTQITLDLYKLVEEKLNEFDTATLSFEEQVSYDVFKWYIANQVANRAFYYHDSISRATLDSIWSVTSIQIKNAEEAEEYINLIKQLPNKIRQLKSNLESAADQGILEPALLIQYWLGGIQYFANISAEEHPISTYYQSEISEISNLNTSQRQSLTNELVSAVAQVGPAFAEFESSATNLMSSAPENIGMDQLSQGAEAYEQKIIYHTSTTLSADEIHQIGLAKVDEIMLELNDAFTSLGYPQDESMAQKFARVEEDGGVIAADDALAVYQQMLDLAYLQTLDAFHSMPTTPLEFEYGSWGYFRAPDDGSDSAKYSAPIYDEQAYFPIPTLTYHEAVPGHHYQISMAQEADLPDFRRHMRFTVYVEGWGLYAEKLAFEMGWYEQDVYGNLGRLQFEIMRAARLVVDTGIHTKGWTFDQAKDYYQGVTGFDEEQASQDIYRYAVNPGQALAYMIGMIELLELRQTARDSLGNSFNLKDFHDEVVGSGAMPMSVLENVVNKYIEDSQ